MGMYVIIHIHTLYDLTSSTHEAIVIRDAHARARAHTHSHSHIFFCTAGAPRRVRGSSVPLQALSAAGV